MEAMRAEGLADGELDGGAVFDDGHGEGIFGGVGVAVGAGFGRGAAGGVVVVAEGLVAQAGHGAALAGGSDVAALEAGWVGLLGLGLVVGWRVAQHVIPPGVFL